MEGFYRKKDGARELLTKEKKVKARDRQYFYHAGCLFFLWVWRGHM